MITRIWNGKTDHEKADEYEAFLRRTAYSDYGDVDGNQGWLLLRNDAQDSTEFVFVSFWESLDALAAYAGPESGKPKYYPEDKAALIDPPDRVDHYRTVDAQCGHDWPSSKGALKR